MNLAKSAQDSPDPRLRKDRQSIIREAEQLAIEGYGWENIAVITGLPAQICRWIVFRRARAA
jgi:hypothetical protein